MPNQLSTGPDLPYPIRGTAMASSPDGNGVILFGGNNWPYSQLHFTASSPLDTILELRSNGQGWASSWTTLTTKLKHSREYHVVILGNTCSHGYRCLRINKREQKGTIEIF